MSESDMQREPEEAQEESATISEPEGATGATRTRAPGALALLLSACALVVALAATGYVVYDDWRDEASDSVDDGLAALERSTRTARESLAELGDRVTKLEQAAGDTEGTIGDLRQTLDDSARAVESLAPRIASLEGSVASLAGVSKGARDAWLVAEAEYYMQIANAQLQLAGNPALAALALRMADERIVQLANPGLTDVRRALSDELAALDAMSKPDIEGLTLTLASLARVVETLPLAGDEREDSGSAATETGESGAGRAWDSMKNAMSGLVRVTPPDQAKFSKLSPDAEYFLRNNIAMQLQAARLALLRGEQSIFEQTLDDTSALLGEYFDDDSAPVMSARETIAEIRGTEFTVSKPDISESLRLLREFRARTGNAQ